MDHWEGYGRIRKDRKAPPPGKLQTWADAYVALRESLSFTTVELKKNLRTLIAFMHERGITSFGKLDRMSAASWLHAGGAQEITVSVRLASVRGFFRYLAGLGEVKENVWDAFTTPKPKPFRPYVFSLAELRAILDHVRSRMSPRRPVASPVRT